MRAQEPDTWDRKLARVIRQLWQGVTGNTPEIDEWERAKFERWDQEEEQARTRSSAELHEELDNQRAKRRKQDGRL